MTTEAKQYTNGQIMTLTVSVYYFPPRWRVTRVAPGELYHFECIGVFSVMKNKKTAFNLHGAGADKPLPAWGPKGPSAKRAIIDPLRQALQTALGVDVKPFIATIIEEGEA